MEDLIQVQAVLNWVKVENQMAKDNTTYLKFSAMCILQENDAQKIKDIHYELLIKNPKAKSRLHPIDREKYPSLDNTYTHYINLSGTVERQFDGITMKMNLMNIKKQEISIDDFSNGDLVYMMFKPMVTKNNTTKEQYLSGFINTLALVTKNYQQVFAKSEHTLDFEKKLEALNDLDLKPTEDLLEV